MTHPGTGRRRLLLLAAVGLCPLLVWAQGRDPLPSWNNGPAKTAISGFVARVTTEGAKDYLPPSERIATFDNDGTLWTEQPVYVQFAFALDRVKALAPQHPEWKTEQPFRAVIEGDRKTLVAGGEAGLMKILAATHAGMTTAEFEASVTNWLATARHPRFKRPYTDLVYQPMLELLSYLRASGFKTYIVSGGGVEFMRPWTERVYGIPPEQVIGSMGKLKYEMRNGQPVLLREPAVDLIDDKEGKPIGIQKFIGRRPVFAAGNSDGDLQMLQWTTIASGARFGLLIHHTDADREWAYDRTSQIGRLDRALTEAPSRGWVVVDMKKEWRVVFPFQK
jgi:hypothetical protein